MVFTETTRKRKLHPNYIFYFFFWLDIFLIWAFPSGSLAPVKITTPVLRKLVRYLAVSTRVSFTGSVTLLYFTIMYIFTYLSNIFMGLTEHVLNWPIWYRPDINLFLIQIMVKLWFYQKFCHRKRILRPLTCSMRDNISAIWFCIDSSENYLSFFVSHIYNICNKDTF